MSSAVGLNVTATASSYLTAAASKTAAKETETKKETQESTGAVYDKTSSDSEKKATYSINKMSAERRAEIVKQMKADQAKRQDQLASIVNKMLTKQAGRATQAGGDDIWKILAKGNLKNVARDDILQAQDDISEDGYYGVKQTSKRIFDFASALAGDDPEKMEEMRKAFEKGFKQATGAWGRELPSISQDTYKAVEKMFDDYAASKKVVTEEA